MRLRSTQRKPASPLGPVPMHQRGPQWQRTLLTLFVGVLLAALCVKYILLVKPRAAPDSMAATISQNVTAPPVRAPPELPRSARANNGPPLDARELARMAAYAEKAEKAREADAAGKREAQSFVLAMLHGLAMPAIMIFLMWIYVKFKVLKDWFGSEAGGFVGLVGDFSMLLVFLSSLILIWRGGYVPLVDLIWDACGGPFFHYENFTSPGRSRRRNGSVARAYLSGTTWVFLLWGAGTVAYFYIAKVSGRRASKD